MLHRPEQTSPYLTQTGAIDRSYVMREAHRRTKAVIAKQATYSEPEAYARVFKRTLSDEAFRARKAKRDRLHSLGLLREPVLTNAVSTFGGRTYIDTLHDGQIVTTIEAI